MTKSESEKLADLRNKFGAIYTHFQIIEEMEKMAIEAPEKYKSIKESMSKIFKDNELIARESMKKVKKILDSFG